MKYLIITLVCFGVFTSCEDVIDVDLSTEEPRLIIDALIRVDTENPVTEVVVKVRETSSFFESNTAVSPERITIENLSQPGGMEPLQLIEQVPGSGVYSRLVDTDFLTEGSLMLQVDFEGEVYVAMTEFVPTVPIDSVVQGDGFLFDENDTEIIITYTDNGDRDDFYLFDFSFGNYLVTEDEFYQGQQFEFSYFYDEEEVSPGDLVIISIMGIDEEFHTYMDEIITQSEDDSGPFQIPTITVRGNFINTTNPGNPNSPAATDNFALGYFAVVQEYKETIGIE